MSKRSRQLSNDTDKKLKISYTFILQAFSENAKRQIFRAERLSGHKNHDHVSMFCDQESKWIQMPIIMSCAVKFNFTINKFLFVPKKRYQGVFS